MARLACVFGLLVALFVAANATSKVNSIESNPPTSSKSPVFDSQTQPVSYTQIKPGKYVPWEPKWCTVHTHYNMLLGIASNGDKVYQTTCEGFCINRKKPILDVVRNKFSRVQELTHQRACRAVRTYKREVKSLERVKVQDNTIGRDTYQVKQTVEIIKKCSCAPPPCTDSDGNQHEEGSRWTDQCERQCQCVDGKSQCCRVRKSIVDMTSADRLKYIDTVRDIALGNLGTTLMNEYNALIEDHETYFSQGIHSGDELLPWHRAYILALENLLRKVDCTITVPFWAWEDEANDLWNSQLWGGSPDWFGKGDASAPTVVDGGFATPPFVLTPSASPATTLSRQRQGSVPSLFQVGSMLAVSANDYSSFFSFINSMHGSVHCAIGGTMCQGISANAPEFFLHHNNMDRLWAKWQDTSAAHATAFSNAIDTPMTSGSIVVQNPSGGTYTPRDFLNIRDHLGVCVEYDDNSASTKIMGIMTRMGEDRLSLIPRVYPRPDVYENAKTYLSLHSNASAANQIVDAYQQFCENGPEIPYQEDPNDYADAYLELLGVDPRAFFEAANDFADDIMDTEPVTQHGKSFVLRKESAKSLAVRDQLEDIDTKFVKDKIEIKFKPTVVDEGDGFDGCDGKDHEYDQMKIKPLF